MSVYERSNYISFDDVFPESKLGFARLNLTKNIFDNGSHFLENNIIASSIKSVDEIFSFVCERIPDNNQKEEYRNRFNRKKLIENFFNRKNIESMVHLYKILNGSILWIETTCYIEQNSSSKDIEAFIYATNVNDEKIKQIILKKIIISDYKHAICLNKTNDSYYRCYSKDSLKKIELEKRDSYNNDTIDFAKNVLESEREYFFEMTSKEMIFSQLEKYNEFEFVIQLYDIENQIIREKVKFSYIDKENNLVLMTRIDVTDIFYEEKRKSAELQEALTIARDANSAKSSFMARVSHEMFTPMNAILGLCSLIESKNNLSPQVLDYVEKISIAGKTLSNIISAILDTGKIDSHEFCLNRHEEILEEMLLDLYNVVDEEAKNKKIKIHFSCDKTLSKSYIFDKKRLSQVLYNVISNSIKFSPIGESIEMKVEKLLEVDNKQNIRFVITDHGIGISEEFLAHIFEPFAQEYNKSTSEYDGIGLGMTIVKKIIQIAGGNIEIKSKKGEGTQTIISIFVLQNLQYHDILLKHSEQQDNNKKLSGVRILLVEDSPINIELSTTLLETWGGIVEVAENGLIGLNMFKNSSINYFQCILMDIRMPVMDGLEAIRRIRALDRSDSKTIPIIVTTANSLPEDLQKTKKVGANAHIMKPIDPQLLLDGILGLLEK